ncbi:GNAT family N-acetyltransferase [Microvirga alba]|uniref:N-acetyltransferase n=1 Tax=Microvirga alba TaxID=2791025 RepID=A0A931BUC7_9HYPH|nr:N-acetyltransferase [Microvirga alba]MBF9234899.1 N-acetyltransferase [Microvirga alba]
MIIEAEDSSHHIAVRLLHVEAFPSPAEADLVDQLRRDGDASISLVAIAEGRVVGHVMFSRMKAAFRALGLAPVAVAVDKRMQGVAAALIEEGIKRAKADGCEGIFVLGDPDYYRRFGFSAGAAAAFESPFAGPHLMLLPLGDMSVPSNAGQIEYAPAFSTLG